MKTEIDTVIERIAADVDNVHLQMMEPTLADMMRAGNQFTEQAVGSFGTGERACAMSSAALAAEAAGFKLR